MAKFKVVKGTIQFGRDDKGRPLSVSVGQSVTEKQIGSDALKRLVDAGVIAEVESKFSKQAEDVEVKSEEK